MHIHLIKDVSEVQFRVCGFFLQFVNETSLHRLTESVKIFYSKIVIGGVSDGVPLKQCAFLAKAG